MTGPGTATFDAEAVADWLRLSQPDNELGTLGVVVAAVRSYIDTTCPDAPRTPAGDWTDTTLVAALILAARLYRRRNSPAGVEAFTDAGAAYVRREDPDVARMLRLDGYSPPRVG